MAISIITQPTSLTAVPGQDTTFSVVASSNVFPSVSASFLYQWSVNSNPIAGATNANYFIDPLIGDSGKSFTVSVSALSGIILDSTTTSTAATITVQEDVPPFDVYDRGTETGRQRHRRLHLLGYI